MNVGELVRVKNSLLYTGRVGTLALTSEDPDDMWDYYVHLLPDADNPARVIGVISEQIEETD